MLARARTFFATNITLSSLWLTAIVVIVVIVSIVALVILVSTIMPPKLTIRKVLSIGNVAVIVYDDG